MRGISEERLKEIFSEPGHSGMLSEGELRRECKELNPWLPIDENIPEMHDLLLSNGDGSSQYVGYKSGGVWYTMEGFCFPTHYQELPDDPKE